MGYYLLAALVLVGSLVFEPSRAMSVLLAAAAALTVLLLKHAKAARERESTLPARCGAGECACVAAGEGLLEARVHGREAQPSLLDQAPRSASQEDWDPPFDDLMRR